MRKQFNREQLSASVGSQAATGAWTRMATSLLLVLVFGLMCAAQSSDESLGEVVRESKPSHKAARVITNDEIPSVAVPQGEPQAGASEPEQNATASSTAAKGAPEAKASKDSKSGITVPGVLSNATLEQARAALGTLKHDREAFINNYDKIQHELSQTENPALRQSFLDILATREKTLARNSKEISDLESAIQAAQNAQGGDHETQ